MPKTVKMKLNRKYRLASIHGHVIVFPERDAVIDVPEAIVREAVDIGAEFVEEGARDEVFKDPERDRFQDRQGRAERSYKGSK